MTEDKGGKLFCFLYYRKYAWEMARFEDSRIRKVEKRRYALIVCGDFGFLWDGGAKEEKNLKKAWKQEVSDFVCGRDAREF